MLFAVEGGEFFSSSATGYRKGLALLLGQRKKDKPKRVLPWNQHHLDQEPDINPQLASTKKPRFRKFVSFACFSCTPTGLDGSSSSKKVLVQNETRLETPVIHTDENHSTIPVGNDLKQTALKSSLRKPSKNRSASAEYSPGQTERKVRWTDACGSELVEIREFEPSEVSDSDDENSVKNCSCVIM